MNTWWNSFNEDYFWMEVTGREDIGENLKAPATDGSGNDYWSYSILKKMYPGDIVLHYDLNSKSILGVSQVSKRWVSKATTWVPSKKRKNQRISRPGLLVDLKDFKRIKPIKLKSIQKQNEKIKNIINYLRGNGKTPYFPFSPATDKRKYLSTNEGYAFIVTEDFINLFPSLKNSIENIETTKESSKQRKAKAKTKNKSKSVSKVNSAKNEAIELYAVKKAIKFYEKKGFTVEEMPRKNYPYDLEAKKGNIELHIEVKGSSVDEPASIDVSRKEVEHSRKNPTKSVLLIVHNIRATLTSKNKYKTSGGKIIEEKPWKIDNKQLLVRSYRYTLK